MIGARAACRAWAVGTMVALCTAPAWGQAERAVTRHPTMVPLPDLSTKLIAVFGERPLTDSTIAVLRRRGLRVADRSTNEVQRARREHRQLEPAQYAVLIEVRPDSLVRGPILVASLLDVQTVTRVRLASSMLPTDQNLGQSVDYLVSRLLEPDRKP